MDWRHDATNDTYTLTVGNIRCFVWRSRGRRWNANVSQHGVVHSVYKLRTAEDAKAWCEAQIAQRKAST
jgi:hypothetical protein